MLHRVELENFYSIREAQVIDLIANGHVPDEPERLMPLWRGCQDKGPKVVALFGANASGKSNVLKAISFLAWFVHHSFSLPPNAQLPFARFNDEESANAVTRLSVHIGGPEEIERAVQPETPQCKYAYELIIGGGNQHTVTSESLHYWPGDGRRKVRLFERNEAGSIRAAKIFGLTGYGQALAKILRPNASVISTLAQLKHPFATMLWQAASTVVSNILIEKLDGTDDAIVRHYAANPKLLEVFNRDVERIDLGISSMELHNGPNGPIAFFRHEGLSSALPFLYESHGTRQFVKLYPLLLQALETGGVAVLDELDAAIHPLLLPEILRWFHDPKRNPFNAQLWMSCHNASLLEELIKEEVLFCDKDRFGRTKVYGLSDIHAVRRTDNYYKKYLGGTYGAVPQIG